MWDFITYFSNKVETKPIKPTQYNKSVTLESWSWKMILHFDWFVISRESNAVDIKSCILCMNGCIVNCAALPNMNICLYYSTTQAGLSDKGSQNESAWMKSHWFPHYWLCCYTAVDLVFCSSLLHATFMRTLKDLSGACCRLSPVYHMCLLQAALWLGWNLLFAVMFVHVLWECLHRLQCTV